MTLEKPGIHRTQFGVSLSSEAQPCLPQPTTSPQRVAPSPRRQQLSEQPISLESRLPNKTQVPLGPP